MNGVDPIHLAMEFRDSEVEWVRQQGSMLRVAFSAAMIHGSTGEPGHSDGIIVLQAVELVLRGIFGHLQHEGHKGKLSQGHVEVHGSRQSLIRLPYSSTGATSISLTFADGHTLEASGEQLEIRRHGEPQFLEVFRC